MPQSTSQLIPPLRPNFTKETSQISVSMSSFVDFDNDTAPGDDHMNYIEETTSLPKQRPQTEEETRKEMLLEVGRVSLDPSLLSLNLCAESRNPSNSTTTSHLQGSNKPNHQTICTSECSEE